MNKNKNKSNSNNDFENGYEVATEYQLLYNNLFNKHLSLEELFKTALFINHIKLKQTPNLKETKQTVLGGS